METTFFRTGGFSIEKTYKGHSPEPPTLVVKWMETTFFSDSTQTLTHRHTHMQWRTQSMGNTFYRDTADSSASRPLRMSSKTLQTRPNTCKSDLIHSKETYYKETSDSSASRPLRMSSKTLQTRPNTCKSDLIHSKETYYKETSDSSASRPLRMSSKTQGNPGFLSSSAPLVSKEAFLHCDNTYKRDLIHTKKTYSYWHT
jgi:hypothetical protein